MSSGAFAHIPGEKPVVLHNPEIVALLEKALADAKSGRMVGLALVCAYGPEKMTVSTAGVQVATLALGCHQLSIGLGQSLFQQHKPALVRN